MWRPQFSHNCRLDPFVALFVFFSVGLPWKLQVQYAQRSEGQKGSSKDERQG